jgi:hypothetical protein
VAIEEQTKTGSAYAAIKDVDTLQKDDRMESFFLAETLKYLYLLQNDNHTIDLLNTVSRTFTDRPLLGRDSNSYKSSLCCLNSIKPTARIQY